jgi:hypothetical protein
MGDVIDFLGAKDPSDKPPVVSEPVGEVEEVMDAQETQISYEEFLLIVRNTLVDHELRLSAMEEFLMNFAEELRRASEDEVQDAVTPDAEVTDESPEHPEGG